MSSSSSSGGLSILADGSRLRLNGTELASGLDTETLIKALTYGTQTRIDNQTFQKEKAQWSQDAYRSIDQLISDFENKYFSYTSSGTNLLSTQFFSSSVLTSSSGIVSATGDTSAAAGLTINSISSLASAATYNSTNPVTDETITSGAIQGSWTTPYSSNVAGRSITVNYNGQDYNLTLGSSVALDPSKSDDENMKTLVDGLNAAVQGSDLNGKIKFSYSGDKITVASDDGSDITVKAYTDKDTNKTDTDFLTALGFTNGQSASSITGSSNVNLTPDSSSLYGIKLAANSYLNLKLDNGEEYTLKLGKDIFLGSDAGKNGQAIADAFNEQIAANPDLKGLKMTVNSNEIVSLTNSSGAFSIVGGSQNLLNGLELTAGNTAQQTFTGKAVINNTELETSYLGDSLAGTKLTFNLDGISKDVTFDVNDESEYNTVSGLANYLNTQLANAFGTGKITVGTANIGTTNKGLTFSTMNSSILSIASSDTPGILGSNGALHIEAGDSNRLNLGESLTNLASDPQVKTPLQAGSDGKYTLSVNGKNFTFTSDQTVSDVLNTINEDPDAGIKISYSQTNDTFNIVSKETGSQGKIDIQDVNGGNLCQVLFGAASVNAPAGTDLKMNVTLNGTTEDITRSANSFTLDGVNLTVTGTTKTGDAPITFTAPSSTDDTYQKISDFIDAYNNIITTINGMMTETPSDDPQYTSALSADKKASMSSDDLKSWETNAKKGILQNDPILENMLSDFFSSMTEAAGSQQSSLAQIGITPTSDFRDGGKLTISDPDKLKNALNQNLTQVEDLFTGTDGLAARMKNTLEKYDSTSYGSYGISGILISKAGSTNYANDELDNEIQNYQSSINDLNTELQSEQNRYIDEFSKMESALSTLNSQYNYLSSYFSSGS